MALGSAYDFLGNDWINYNRSTMPGAIKEKYGIDLTGEQANALFYGDKIDLGVNWRGDGTSVADGLVRNQGGPPELGEGGVFNADYRRNRNTAAPNPYESLNNMGLNANSANYPTDLTNTWGQDAGANMGNYADTQGNYAGPVIRSQPDENQDYDPFGSLVPRYHNTNPWEMDGAGKLGGGADEIIPGLLDMGANNNPWEDYNSPDIFKTEFQTDRASIGPDITPWRPLDPNSLFGEGNQEYPWVGRPFDDTSLGSSDAGPDESAFNYDPWQMSPESYAELSGDGGGGPDTSTWRPFEDDGWSTAGQGAPPGIPWTPDGMDTPVENPFEEFTQFGPDGWGTAGQGAPPGYKTIFGEKEDIPVVDGLVGGDRWNTSFRGGDTSFTGGANTYTGGSVTGGDVDFSNMIGKGAFEGMNDFGNMFSVRPGETGAFGGMNDFEGMNDFSNMFNEGAFAGMNDFAGMNTDMFSEGAFADMNDFEGMFDNAQMGGLGGAGGQGGLGGAGGLGQGGAGGSVNFGDYGMFGEAGMFGGSPLVNIEGDSLPDWARGSAQDLVGEINPWLRQSLGLNVGETVQDAMARFNQAQGAGAFAPPQHYQSAIDSLTTDEWTRLINQSTDYGSAPGTVGTGGTEGFAFGSQMPDDGFDVGDAPVLDMPMIDDYASYLREPYLDSVMGGMYEANPYDTRRDAIMAGPNNEIDKRYDEMMENVNHRFGVNDDLGSPAYRQAIADLEQERADAKVSTRSRFELQAAGTDESYRRGRQSDLGSAMGTMYNQYQTDLDQQAQYQRDANDDYYRYLDTMQNNYYRPLEYQDEGLRNMLGGIGSTLSPSGTGASNALGSAASAYADRSNRERETNANVANAGMDLGSALYNRFYNPGG